MSKLVRGAFALAFVAVGASAAAQPAPPSPEATAPPAPAAAAPAAQTPVTAEPAPPAAPATTTPAETAQAAPATPPSVGYTVHATRPSFVAMTALTGGLGVIGSVMSMRQGSDMEEMYGLTDPVLGVAPGLAKLYATSRGVTVADNPLVVPNDDIKAVLGDAKAQGLSYIVDISTYVWESLYFPFDWTHYGVMYGARFQVVEVATGKAIVSGRCFQKAQKTPDSPNGDQLIANRAEVLKKMLSSAAERCAEDLKTKTLKL